MLSSESTTTVFFSSIFVVLFFVCVRLILSARLHQDIDQVEEIRTRCSSEITEEGSASYMH